jgi:hypothetical protein
MKKFSDAEAVGVARDLCVLLLYYGFHTVVSNKLKGWGQCNGPSPQPLYQQE